MRIDEITRPYGDDLYRLLHRGGWEEIGAGIYGEVFGKPGVDYVLKVFAEKDRAYLDFLDLISRHDNPHFPVIKGKLVRINDHYLAVRLERLTPATGQYRRMLDPLKSWLTDEKGMAKANKQEANKIFKQFPYFKKALTLIRKQLSHHTFDLHGGNLMMRGNEPVIIDPVQ